MSNVDKAAKFLFKNYKTFEVSDIEVQRQEKLLQQYNIQDTRLFERL